MSAKIGIRAWIDFAFRKIFGKPGNEICLISLLNAVLQFPDPIVSVEYLNPFGMRKSVARVSWSNGRIGSRIRVNTPSTSYESCFQAWSSFERPANWMRFER